MFGLYVVQNKGFLGFTPPDVVTLICLSQPVYTFR